MEFEVGDIVFLEGYGRYVGTIVVAEIIKVDSKYYTVEIGEKEMQFYKDRLVNVYTHGTYDYKMYKTTQEIHDKIEHTELLRKICRFFSFGKVTAQKELTLEELKVIFNIINKKE